MQEVFQDILIGYSRAPLVSVVMPTYNRADYIGYSIISVLTQSLGDFELLVVDDASDDRTGKVVYDFADTRVRYCRNDVNLGMPKNLNVGIRAARGRYIVVCHDHDLFERNVLQKMVSLLESQPCVGMVHAGIAMIDKAGQKTGRVHVSEWDRVTPGKEWLRFMLSSFHCPVCANAMVHREVYDRIGLYDPQYGFVADVEMWMRMSRHYDIGYLCEPLVLVRERDDNHPLYGRSGWSMAEGVMKIHRKYRNELRRSWTNSIRFWLRTEKHLSGQYLSCLKNRRTQDLGLGKSVLKRYGGLFCRLLAVVT